MTINVPSWYSRAGASRMDEPPDHLEPHRPKSIRDTMDTVAKLSLFVRIIDAQLELLEVARQQLGVASIDDGRGVASFDKEGLTLDSFNAENRQIAMIARMPTKYTARRLSS